MCRHAHGHTSRACAPAPSESSRRDGFNRLVYTTVLDVPENLRGSRKTIPPSIFSTSSGHADGGRRGGLRPGPKVPKRAAPTAAPRGSARGPSACSDVRLGSERVLQRLGPLEERHGPVERSWQRPRHFLSTSFSGHADGDRRGVRSSRRVALERSKSHVSLCTCRSTRFLGVWGRHGPSC